MNKIKATDTNIHAVLPESNFDSSANDNETIEKKIRQITNKLILDSLRFFIFVTPRDSEKITHKMKVNNRNVEPLPGPH